MKKIFAIFIFTLICGSSYSQNLNALDSKNGFRKFILGSPAESYHNLIKIERSRLISTVTVYNYKGNDIKNVFGVEVENISLFFFKNKLSAIQIEFGRKDKQFTKENFENLYLALCRSYGSNTKTLSDQSNVLLNGEIWKGKKVTLEIKRVDFAKSKLNRDENDIIIGAISIYDNLMQTEMYKSEF